LLFIHDLFCGSEKSTCRKPRKLPFLGKYLLVQTLLSSVSIPKKKGGEKNATRQIISFPSAGSRDVGLQQRRYVG
jgi:hypothetical protein